MHHIQNTSTPSAWHSARPDPPPTAAISQESQLLEIRQNQFSEHMWFSEHQFAWNLCRPWRTRGPVVSVWPQVFPLCHHLPAWSLWSERWMDLGAHCILSFSTEPSLRAVSTQTLRSEVQCFVLWLRFFWLHCWKRKYKGKILLRFCWIALARKGMSMLYPHTAHVEHKTSKWLKKCFSMSH